MYAGRVAWCLLVSHVKYAPRAILRLGIGTDRQTDGRQNVTLRLPLDAASVISEKHVVIHQMAPVCIIKLCLNACLSVCLSVCLSACLSYACIVLKRPNRLSNNQSHR